MTVSAVSDLAQQFMRCHPSEAAVVLERAEPTSASTVLLPLDAAASAELLRRMSADTAAPLLASMADDRANDVLNAADFIAAASWLGQLEDERREHLLGLLPERNRRQIREALEFPPGSAGQLMDSRAMAFREGATIDEALERMRRAPDFHSAELIVTDDDGRVTGLVSLQRLVVAPKNATIGSLADRNRPLVSPLTTRDEVVEILNRDGLATLPVVDFEGRLLGVLRHDALVRAAQHAATDDLQQMVGASKHERALSSPIFTVRSRLPWLLINLFTGFIAASVVGLFDATIAKLTALAVLMPVVAGQAGNTGAQALAVVSRGLALREIRTSHALRVFRKEALAALVNGIVVACATAVGTYLWSGNTRLAAVTGISMIGSMIIAATAGAAVPIVLTALKRDPATASSIILTTVTDVSGFFSFLGLATLMAELIASG